MIRRHDHHHRRAELLRAAAARGADARAEMRRRDDDGHAAGDVLEHRRREDVALFVGEHELLGEIREDAEAVRAGIDHEIDAAPLALEIERAALVEYGRHDRKYACQPLAHRAGSLNSARAGIFDVFRLWVLIGLARRSLGVL